MRKDVPWLRRPADERGRCFGPQSTREASRAEGVAEHLQRRMLRDRGTIAVDHEQLVDLGVPNYSGFQIRLSPDGRQIAFTAGDPPKRELRLLENVVPAKTAKK